MTPSEFLDELQVHFSKRHASEEAHAIWVRDMIAVVRGTDFKVLATAYKMIVDEHTERAFPLPAQLRKFIERACEKVFPERPGSSPKYNRPIIPRNDSPEFIKACEEARIWQTAIIKQYGSWEAHWRATRHTHVRKGGKVRVRIAPKPPARFPAAKLRLLRRRNGQRDVSRPAMELLQRYSPNKHLHVDHAALTRRITGERE